jgi:hypothetical protein
VITALLLISGLALGQAATAPAAADGELKTKVEKLVPQLDSNEAAKREAAEKELIALGPEVLPLLPTTGPRTPAEVRIRLGRIRTALVKAEVEAATRATVVSLAGEMPVSQAMAELTRQTGNKLVDYRGRFNQEVSDPKITVALDKVSFWQALDTVLDAANLTIYNFDDEKAALAYTSRGDNAAKRLGGASYSGLFRLEPAKIEATRDLKNSALHALKLTIDAAWEPRVRPIVLEVPLAELSAKDENGGEISIDRTEGTLEVPVEANNAAVELELPLTAPPWGVKTLASIKGKITAVVLGKVESFEFTSIDKANAATQERGGVTVTVESCRKNGDIYDVSMRVRFDRAANALESHRGWIYENECYLLDAKGNRKGNDGLEANLLDVNEVGVAYKFDLGEKGTPAGYKLVYRTPAAIIKIPVEFELKNIDRP